MRVDWQPACTLDDMRLRAEMLSSIRNFFAVREVMEVETPILCQGIGTDPNLQFFSSRYKNNSKYKTLYLQTSPEFAMKRLLAAGSGSIFQICKAFRNGEYGRYHNPEFTLLEWYRTGFNLKQLMDEIIALLQEIIDSRVISGAVESYSYQHIFKLYTGLDPLSYSLVEYRRCAVTNNLPEAQSCCGNDHSVWLDFMFSHLVQPNLGRNAICLVYDYPACQSSLARLNSENPLVTERVEVFVKGVELGNGYQELTNPDEQEYRFDKELLQRKHQNLPNSGKDQRFLAAIRSGLPDCAGMAIGLDRLLMVMTGTGNIDQLLAFPFNNA